MADIATWGKVFAWAWDKRKEIAEQLRDLRAWFGRGGTRGRGPGILVLGAAGTGKSTVAKFLTGQADLLLDPPGQYRESLATERYCLAGAKNLELVVPPGQRHRRQETWTTLLSEVAAGKFRGIVLVNSFGYHDIRTDRIRRHKLFQGKKAEFVDALLEHNRRAEIEVLNAILPAIQMCPRKLWVLVVVSKQDLWWGDRERVESYYEGPEYRRALEGLHADGPNRPLRIEVAFASLAISNFRTAGGELVVPNTSGYDQQLQVASLRRLIETVDALRSWGEEP